MTEHTTRRRPRPDTAVGSQLSGLHGSGVRGPSPVRTHLPGTSGSRPDPATAALLPLRLRPVCHAASTGRRTRRANRRKVRRRPSRRDGCGWWPRWRCCLVVGLVIALVIANSSTAGDGRRTARRCPSRVDHNDQATADDHAALRPLPARSSRHPTTTPPSESATPGGNRDGGLHGHRQRPGHQHHLRRHRRRAADRVQRRAAVAQGSRTAKPRQGFGERDDHQRRAARSPARSRSTAPRSRANTGNGLTICTALR